MADKLPPAVEKLKARWEADPGSRVFLQLAEEYRKLGMLDDAVDVCRKGLDNHPSYFTARVSLARSYMEKGRIDEAGSELKKVIESSPGNITANRLLGQVYYKKGQYYKALNRFEMVKQLNPLDEEVPKLIAELEKEVKKNDRSAREKDLEEARAEFERGIPLDVEDDSSTVKISEREIAEAEEEEEWTDDKVDVKIFDDTGELDVSGGEIIHAEENGEQVREKKEAEAVSEENGGRESVEGEHDNGELPGDEALREGEESLLEIEDEEPEIKLFEDDAGSFEEESAGDTEDLLEEDDLTSETLAELYERQGHIDKAIKVYEKMLLSDPSNPRINEKLAELSKVLETGGERTLIEKEEYPEKPEPPAMEEDARRRLADEIRDLKNTGRKDKVGTLKNWLSTVKKEKRK